MKNLEPRLQLSTNDFDVQAFLSYRINILAKRMSTALSDIYMSEFDITIPEWRTLLWTHSNERVYAKDISFHCLMDKTQVSRVISNLEQRGLLTRTVDQADQRSFLLSLTEEGKTLIEQIIPKATEWENKLMSVVTEAQNQELFRLIDQMESRILEMEKEGL